MNILSHLPYRLFAAAALLIVTIQAHADIDKKYFSKIAKEIWAEEMPMFNPKADLSDSLYQNRSAVFIARYVGLVAKYDDSANPGKYNVTGVANSNCINARSLQRTMVKLFDKSAVESFSEFSIAPPQKEDLRGFLLYSIKPSFGARIHKPDGTVTEVDLKEALTVTKGKKKKEDEEYKIAVPGLEVGDVLEYFYCNEYAAEEMSLHRENLSLLKGYPTKHLVVECSIAPQLAFEYGNYNGAPAFTADGRTKDGLNHCFIEITDMNPVEEKMPFFSEARQMPYLVMHVLNNTARLEFISSTARPGGIRKMVYPYLIQDAAAAIRMCKLPDKVEGTAFDIVKNWRKNHPDASEREIADAAWMAIRYAGVKEETRITPRQYCVIFYNIIEKLKLTNPVRVALTSSRKDVPVTEMASYRDIDYIAMLDNVAYFPDEDVTTLPGETPENYCGEEAIMFNAPPSNPQLHTFAQKVNLAPSKPKDHCTESELTARIDPENEENLLVEHTRSYTGALKSTFLSLMSMPDWQKEYERYLGLKPAKRKDNSNGNIFKELLEQNPELVSEHFWGKDSRVDSITVVNKGLTPDDPMATYRMKGSVQGLISQAGNGLMVNIGTLYGKQIEVKGSERNRDVAVVMATAHRQRSKIRLRIPDGYSVNPESLESLNRQVITPEASFFTEATLDGNDVVVNIAERYMRALYPAESWPNILKVLDAASEFSSASIILNPK